MFLEFKELLLESWVWEDDWTSFTSVGQSIQHGQPQLFHEIGDDN